MNNVLYYFFSLKGDLNQKKYILHYFLDFFIFTFLAIFLVFPIYILGDRLEGLIWFGVKTPVFLFATGSIVVFSLLVMNRLSILMRRLSFLNMNKFLVVLLFIPLIGLLFDLYLILIPDSKKVTTD